MKNYVLDSYAVLAYLQNEKGADTVAGLLEKASRKEAGVFLCTVNLGEVAYITQRKGGRKIRDLTLSAIDLLPVKTVDADRKTVLEAAEIKAGHALSFADCFALALARRLEATVVTGDPEFEKVGELAPILWL